MELVCPEDGREALVDDLRRLLGGATLALLDFMEGTRSSSKQDEIPRVATAPEIRGMVAGHARAESVEVGRATAAWNLGDFTSISSGA